MALRCFIQCIFTIIRAASNIRWSDSCDFGALVAKNGMVIEVFCFMLHYFFQSGSFVFCEHSMLMHEYSSFRCDAFHHIIGRKYRFQ